MGRSPFHRLAAGAAVRGADRLRQPVSVHRLARPGHRALGLPARALAPVLDGFDLAINLVGYARWAFCWRWRCCAPGRAGGGAAGRPGHGGAVLRMECLQSTCRCAWPPTWTWAQRPGGALGALGAAVLERLGAIELGGACAAAGSRATPAARWCCWRCGPGPAVSAAGGLRHGPGLERSEDALGDGCRARPSWTGCRCATSSCSPCCPGPRPPAWRWARWRPACWAIA
jgi:hypothetical protein